MNHIPLSHLKITQDTLQALGLEVPSIVCKTIEALEHKEPKEPADRIHLCVRFEDNTILNLGRNTQTFRKAIEMAGPDRIHELHIIKYGRELLTATPKPDQRKKYHRLNDKFYIADTYSGAHMKEILEEISERLELGWEIID